MYNLKIDDKRIIKALKEGYSFPEIAKLQSITVPMLKKRVFALQRDVPGTLAKVKDNADLELWLEELSLGKFINDKKSEYYKNHKGCFIKTVELDSLSNLSFPEVVTHIKQVSGHYLHLNDRRQWFYIGNLTTPKREEFVGMKYGKINNLHVITDSDFDFLTGYMLDHDFTLCPKTLSEGFFYYVGGNLHKLTKDEIRHDMALEKPFQLEKRIIGGTYPFK